MSTTKGTVESISRLIERGDRNRDAELRTACIERMKVENERIVDQTHDTTSQDFENNEYSTGFNSSASTRMSEILANDSAEDVACFLRLSLGGASWCVLLTASSASMMRCRFFRACRAKLRVE